MKLSYRQMSILLVDSNNLALSTMEEYLASMDFYRVWTANKAEQAMEVLKEREISLVITSNKLTPISGLQLVDMIRKQKKPAELPVVVVLQSKDETLNKRAVASGADAVTHMPLKPQDFRDLVDKTLTPMIDQAGEEYLAQMDLAKKSVKKGETDKAVEAYEAALACRPDDELARLGLGRVLHKSGQQEKAAGVFEEAIEKNPESLKSYLALAALKREGGDMEAAVEVMTKAGEVAQQIQEAGTTRASILFYVGEMNLELKRLQAALAAFNQASELSAGDAGMNSAIGDQLFKHDHLEESEAFYIKALEIDPQLAHVYNRLGMAYRRQKKYDLAINLYGKAIAFHPEDDHLMYNIARCQWDMGDLDQAVASLDRAMEINPAFKEASQLKEIILDKKGEKVLIDRSGIKLDNQGLD